MVAFADVAASPADVIGLGHPIQIGLGGRADGRVLFLNHLVDHAAERGSHQVLRHGVGGLHLIAVDAGFVELAAQGFHRLHRPFR